MARFRDLPHAVSALGAWGLVRRVWQRANQDNIFVWASALSFSWLFAVFPFLIFLLSLVPYLPHKSRDSAWLAVSQFIDRVLGKGAATINDNIDKVIHQPHHGWLGLSLLLSLWVASSGMGITMSAMDICYEIKKGRNWFMRRVVAILLTIFVTVFMLLVFVLLPVGSGVEMWLRSNNLMAGGLDLAFNVGRYAVAAMLLLVVLACIYQFGPSKKLKVTIFSPGAVFVLLATMLMEYAFRFYIDHYARYDQTYGAAGGVVLLLFYFYLAALLLLAGGEINGIVDRTEAGPMVNADC